MLSSNASGRGGAGGIIMSYNESLKDGFSGMSGISGDEAS